MTPLLEVDRLTLSLTIAGGRRVRVINEVTLSVAAGEAVGIVGESGAGKSVTARAIPWLMPRGAETEGDIRFDGRSVPAMDRRALRQLRSSDVAMIFQDPRSHMNPVRRVGDFLTEGLRTTAGMAATAATDRAAELLRLVGIDEAERVLSQYPHELSGGMLQRAMIAAALATEPRLLIADEPTTALDVTTQATFMKLLAELRGSRELAMVFISHDLALAAENCDRTIVMYAGRVVEDRRSSTLPEEARHPYTAGLYAARPSLHRRTSRVPSIAGAPRPAWEVTTACAFATRCAFAQQRCIDERPALREVDGGLTACHFAHELRESLTEMAEGGDG